MSWSGYHTAVSYYLGQKFMACKAAPVMTSCSSSTFINNMFEWDAMSYMYYNYFTATQSLSCDKLWAIPIWTFWWWKCHVSHCHSCCLLYCDWVKKIYGMANERWTVNTFVWLGLKIFYSWRGVGKEPDKSPLQEDFLCLTSPWTSSTVTIEYYGCTSAAHIAQLAKYK